MKPVFDIVLKSLEEAGYNNYWQVMNCADYELPQSRERVLIVSIRKDVDDGKFSFPATVPLTTCMGDYLDDEPPSLFRVILHGTVRSSDPPYSASKTHPERIHLQFPVTECCGTDPTDTQNDFPSHVRLS